jgi:hypothetical protein
MTVAGDMSEREYDSTLELLIKDISNNDLDRIILQLQFMRSKRKRDFQSTVMYGFCDKCNKTFPAIMRECYYCDKTLRVLPIRVDYDYLLDGVPKNGNDKYTIVSE